VRAGGVTFHGHRTIHWGTACARAGSVAGPPPATRLSLSCCFADAAFEPPYLTGVGGGSAAKPAKGKGKGKGSQAQAAGSLLPFPPHAHRAALLSAQLINYSSLVRLPLPVKRRFTSSTYPPNINK
jgi:hypothetical protein